MEQRGIRKDDKTSHENTERISDRENKVRVWCTHLSFSLLASSFPLTWAITC